jgi:SNF2 family DNA or RNA helicase
MSKEESRQLLADKLKKGAVPKGFVIPGWPLDLPPFSYQQTGICWLYLTPKALLLDSTGTGKTIHALGLLQYLKSKGKFGPQRRALIIVPAISVYSSWKADGFDKFVPEMKVAVGRGTKKQRLEIYSDPEWEVLLTNYELVRIDIKELEKLGFDIIIIDEVEFLSNHSMQTAKAVKKLTSKASRNVGMTATPIKNKLLDLHGLFEVIGLGTVLGTKKQFMYNHHKHKMVRVFYGGGAHWTKKLIGYKNTKALKQKIAPYILRRTYDDVDIPIPKLHAQVKWLTLTTEQRKLYEKVQAGFLGLDEHSNPIEVKNAALRLRQICTTTANVGQGDSSCKFDYLEQKLTGDWANEKVILFTTWKPGIAAVEARLRKLGIGHVTITGDVKNQKVREELRQRFWNDPDCRVLIGTEAIVRSLNLQCARIQHNVDLLYNPTKHIQLAGRHRRVGSEFSKVFVFSTLAIDTIEEAMLKACMEKSALSDHMFDDWGEVFDKLSTSELVKLIRS